jgi:AcrR family transcriptional regulator
MTDTRERLLRVSAGLFREHGYAGTGLKRVVAEAGVQMGSLYHFFPGGKEELAVAVVRWQGEQQAAYLDTFFGSGADLVAAVDDYFAAADQALRDSDYAAACPITMLALESVGTSEVLRQAAAAVFENWVARLARHLAAGGVPAPAARELAVSALAGIEGAFVLSRTTRCGEAIEAVRAAAVTAVRAALSVAPALPGHH